MGRGLALLFLGLVLQGAVALPGPTPIVPEASYPEGPLWHQGKLYYVEYGGHRVMAWDGKTSVPIWQQAETGPAALAALAGGDLLVALYDANRLVQIAPGGRVRGTITKAADGSALVGPNDFAADGHGGLFFSCSGAFDVSAPISGKLFHRDAGGTIREVARHLHYPNGLAVTDGGKTLLVNEHLTARVLSFKVVARGVLGDRKVFRRLRDIAPDPAGADAYLGPDGLKVDGKGRVYICQYGAGRVLITDPKGALLRTLTVPEPYVTNVAFGPNDTIFVTSTVDTHAPPYHGRVYKFALNAP